ncbi:MAG TPA: hypothetical protein VF581_13560 [Flavobacterium sp.]|jgi:hypothetical protein
MIAGVPFTWAGLIKSVVIGAFNAAVTCGIGELASGITHFASRATFQAVAHGTFQGMVSGVQDGNFFSGFASGSLSSIATSAWMGGKTVDSKGIPGTVKGLGGKFSENIGGILTFGAISGGAGAAMTKGNFWQGAVTGLVVSGLNHAMHSQGDEDMGGKDETAIESTENGKKPFVVNKSKRTAYYKPENTGEAKPLAPGETTFVFGIY